MKFKYILILTFIILQSCIYDFEPDNLKYEDRLVVYGSVTNETQNVEVSLSRTVAINAEEYQPETGALVEIVDGSGKKYDFAENEEGKYTSIQKVEGKIGESYQLMITTKDNQKYESDIQTINEPNDITSLSYEIIERETDKIDKKHKGCEFYLDLNIPDGKSKFYRYELDETWQIQMPLTASHIWNGEDYEILENRFPRTCWRSDNLNIIKIISAYDQGSDKIRKYPLTYVSNESSRLLIKYCLTVRQYTLSEQNYLFWKSQLDNISDNSLYAKQPYQVIGNIKNINNPDEIVLGIFEASGVTTKNIFAENLGSIVSPPGEFPDCKLMEIKTEGKREFYAYMTTPVGPMMRVNQHCVDCEKSGASTTAPDFWED